MHRCRNICPQISVRQPLEQKWNLDCPRGWTKIPKLDKSNSSPRMCYKHVNSSSARKYTWEDGLNKCKKYQATLPIFRKGTETEELFKYLRCIINHSYFWNLVSHIGTTKLRVDSTRLQHCTATLIPWCRIYLILFYSPQFYVKVLHARMWKLGYNALVGSDSPTDIKISHLTSAVTTQVAIRQHPPLEASKAYWA